MGLPTGPFLNAEAIYKGLLSMGLSTDAAAGVAGNIYQESHGNPGIGSSAGGGLFGETIANAGSSSGGSLTEQLSALKNYIAKNGSVAEINAHASSPTEAAQYFMQQYERPNAAAANESARVDAANWVADSAKSGNWGSSSGTDTPDTAAPASGDSSGGLLSIPYDITNFFTQADTVVKSLMWLTKPGNWVRIIAFFGALAILFFAVHAMLAVGQGDGAPLLPKVPMVVPV
jgi:hypothetical protein